MMTVGCNFNAHDLPDPYRPPRISQAENWIDILDGPVVIYLAVIEPISLVGFQVPVDIANFAVQI